MKRYQKLKLNFRIPDFLENDIHAFIQYLNEDPTGALSDCYEAEIRSDINWCDCLTKEQAAGTVRFTLGKENTQSDIDYTIRTILNTTYNNKK